MQDRPLQILSCGCMRIQVSAYLHFLFGAGRCCTFQKGSTLGQLTNVDWFAHSVERTWKNQEHKHHSKLSGTEVTKKNVSSFEQSWHYQKICICATTPASCKLQASLGPSLYQEATRDVEDVRRDWSYTMIYRSKESEWEKCWISMALYSQCLQLAGTWTGRLWNQIRQGHWRRGLFIPNAWSCWCKHKGQIPNHRIMRKREVLQKHHRHDTVTQDDLPADRKSVLILLLACRLQTFSLCFHQLFQIEEHQTDMFYGCQIDRFRFHRWY